jgi:transposase InsO family protein
VRKFSEQVWGVPDERRQNYLTIYNTIRPHEAIGFTTPISRYLQAPSTPPGANLQAPATVSDP